MKVSARYRGEVVQVEAEFLKKRGVWHRPDTSDSSMIKDCVKNYKAVYENPKLQGAMILDLGANIGMFAKLALAAGAAHVVMVEADPVNVEMCRLNLKEEIEAGRATVIPKAVVSKQQVNLFGDGTMPFYTSNAKNSLCSGSTVAGKARPNHFDVEVTTVEALEAEYGFFSVVKCDIEGGEYALLDSGAIGKEWHQILAVELHRKSNLPKYDYWMARLVESPWVERFRKENIVFKQLFAMDMVVERE